MSVRSLFVVVGAWCLGACSKEPADGTKSRAAPGGSQEGLAPSRNASRAAPLSGGGSGLIVVLGSSTAAHMGPSDPDDAWVPRYRAYLAKEYPRFKLTNLAVSGYTTYHVQPSGYVPAPNRPRPVSGRNITSALGLAPHAIIVNLPSNDQAYDYSQQEQQANYDRIAALTTAAGVLLWVTTTQPRNFSQPLRLTSLLQTRDVIFEKFGPRALDFWSPLAEPRGTIKPEYDSGDGIHLNDDAHALLAAKVIGARIPEAILVRRD